MSTEPIGASPLRRAMTGLVAAAASAAALSAPLPLHAQADTARVEVQADTSRAGLIRRLPPGTTLRATAGTDVLTGSLRSVSGDTVYLNGYALPLHAIDRLQVRQRSTMRGMRTGAIIGAPVGAALAGFGLLVAAGLCEYECPDVNAGTITGWLLGGGVAGAVAGGATGATIGATVPRWVDLRDVRMRPVRGVDVAARRSIGSIAVLPVLAHGEGADDFGAGVRAAYVFQTPHISFGPELGLYRIGTSMRPRLAACDELQFCLDTVPTSGSVFHAGAIARVGTGAERRVEPFGTLGFGLYSWSFGIDGIELGGYSAGGGVNLRSASRRQALIAEVRWQSNLTRSGDIDGRYGFYTFALGGSLAW